MKAAQCCNIIKSFPNTSGGAFSSDHYLHTTKVMRKVHGVCGLPLVVSGAYDTTVLQNDRVTPAVTERGEKRFRRISGTSGKSIITPDCRCERSV